MYLPMCIYTHTKIIHPTRGSVDLPGIIPSHQRCFAGVRPPAPLSCVATAYAISKSYVKVIWT